MCKKVRKPELSERKKRKKNGKGILSNTKKIRRLGMKQGRSKMPKRSQKATMIMKTSGKMNNNKIKNRQTMEEERLSDRHSPRFTKG